MMLKLISTQIGRNIDHMTMYAQVMSWQFGFGTRDEVLKQKGRCMGRLDLGDQTLT